MGELEFVWLFFWLEYRIFQTRKHEQEICACKFVLKLSRHFALFKGISWTPTWGTHVRGKCILSLRPSIKCRPSIKYKMYHSLVICCKFEFLNDTEEGAIDSKLATDTKKIYLWLNFVSSLVRSPIGNGFLAWLVNQKTFSFFFWFRKYLIVLSYVHLTYNTLIFFLRSNFETSWWSTWRRRKSRDISWRPLGYHLRRSMGYKGRAGGLRPTWI